VGEPAGCHRNTPLLTSKIILLTTASRRRT
jgi:hypothetical protein